MNVLEQQVNTARRQLNRQRFVSLFPWVLCLSWFVALLAIAVPKLWHFADSSPLSHTGIWMSSWLVGATVVAAILTAILVYSKRATRFHSAMEIDRRTGLRERTATAISLGEVDRSSAAGQIVLEDANRKLDGVDLKSVFQIRVARTSPLALLTLVAAILVGLLAPNAPAPTPELVALNEVVNQEQLESTAEELKEKLKEQLKLAEDNGLEEAAELFRALEKQASEFEGKSEMSKKEALVKLNDLKDQLEERAKELGNAKEMKEAFAKLDDLKQGPADKLMEAMKEGEFGKATEQLNKLAEQLGNDELSAEQKQELEQQIKQLAEQLSEMAQQRQQQQQALEQQIAEAQQEGNLEKAAELQEQLEQLQKQQGNSPQQLQELAQQLQQAAENLQQNAGDPRPHSRPSKDFRISAQKLEGMQQQMDELESLGGSSQPSRRMQRPTFRPTGTTTGQQSGQQGQQAASGSLAQGSQGDQPGQGMGEGQGVGARPENETETGAFESKVDGKPQAGEVVISGKVGGPNQTGQSKAEIQQAIQSALGGDVDPVGEQQLPRSKRDHVKEYFDKLRKRGD